MSDRDDWLGLAPADPGCWSFELTPGLSRFDGKLYGGTGLAAVTAAMEAETGRAALWSTVQFAGSAEIGERIDCRVEVLAQGRRTSQVRMTACVGERVVLAALGATGEPRGGGLAAQVGEIPAVGLPEDTPPWSPKVPFTLPVETQGWLELAEIREVPGLGSRMALWARMRQMRQTRATLGFLADLVPTAVVRAAGRAGAGTSLDNAIRFGPAPDTEWVLLDLDPYLASDGYLHGAARIWAPDGTLLAVASQTAVALLFD